MDVNNTYLLDSDLILTRDAIKHSKYMYDNNKLSHDNFKNRSGKYDKMNENVAIMDGQYSYSISHSLVDFWSNSSTHKKNIFDHTNKIGVGIIYDNKTGLYWITAIFGYDKDVKDG